MESSDIEIIHAFQCPVTVATIRKIYKYRIWELLSSGVYEI